jgi:hypothetical protein
MMSPSGDKQQLKNNPQAARSNNLWTVQRTIAIRPNEHATNPASSVLDFTMRSDLLCTRQVRSRVFFLLGNNSGEHFTTQSLNMSWMPAGDTPKNK